MTTYYPTTYGAAEFGVSSVSTSGTATFSGNTQADPNSYIVISPLGNTGPGGALQFSTTFGYTGPGTGTTITTTQTIYSDVGHTETYGYYPVTTNGNTTYYPAYFLLTNGTVSLNDPPYTFDSAGSDTATQFVPTGGSTTDPTVCFAEGTLIRTTRGDVPVEKLSPGDHAVTASGAHRTIRWLGHRTINCCRHPRPRDVMPIRIAAGAMGPSHPTRDLVVSPGHAICVDIMGEVLIPAGALVNNTTICQLDIDAVTYWHVELDVHDILLAENLPCESYLDMGNRSFFNEAAVVDLAADPDLISPTHADFCRPFHATGPLVEAVQVRLHAVARTLPALSASAADHRSLG